MICTSCVDRLPKRRGNQIPASGAGDDRGALCPIVFTRRLDVLKEELTCLHQAIDPEKTRRSWVCSYERDDASWA